MPPAPIRETTRRRRGLRRLILPGQPERRAGTARGLSLPAGLVGAIIAIALVEMGVAWRALDITPTVTQAWTLSGEDARSAAPGHAVLAAGDSLMKHGVQPRIVEARLGLATLNLAIPAATAPATYFVLRRALEAGAEPEAVVVDFAPDILSGSPTEALRNWPELLTTREWLDLIGVYGDREFLARSALDRLLPTVRARFEIRAGVMAALGGTSASYREATLDHRTHWRAGGGAHLAPKNPAFDGVITEEEHRRLMSGGFWCHRVNAQYVTRLLDLTAGRGIPVYWLLPPLSPALQERREASGADARYAELVESYTKRYPHVTVLDARASGYPHGVFVDPRHLDRDGAITLSVDLAAALERHRAGIPCPSWVMLPAYRSLAVGADLHDISQVSQARYHASAR